MQLLSSYKASNTGYTGGRVLDLIVLYRKLYVLECASIGDSVL